MVTRCFSPSDSVTPCSPTSGVVSLRQRLDGLVDRRQARRRHDLIGPRAGPAERDVLAQARREHQRRLEHHGDLPAQRAEAIVPHVDAVDEDAPAVGVVEARQEAQEGRLARPRRAHDRDLPSRPDGEAHPVEHAASRNIAEGDVLPLDLAPRARGRKLAAPVGHRVLEVEHLEDALDPDPRSLGEPPGVEHAVERAIERGEIRDEDHQGPEAERAVHHVSRAHPHHRRGAERDQHADCARVDALQRVQPPAGGQAPPARRHEAPLLVVLARERLDDPHRRHRALDEGVHLAVALARISGGAGDAGVEPRDDEEQERADAERQERQLPVEREHDRAHARERHQRGHGRKQAVHREGLQRQRVGGDPVEEIADAGPAVKAERQAVQMRVEIASQRGHHRAGRCRSWCSCSARRARRSRRESRRRRRTRRGGAPAATTRRPIRTARAAGPAPSR